jgi:hypothetical protein
MIEQRDLITLNLLGIRYAKGGSKEKSRYGDELLSALCYARLYASDGQSRNSLGIQCYRTSQLPPRICVGANGIVVRRA